MVKSGSFKVSQGSTAGRFGAGLGKGLGEALPKEVAQQRLSSGLKNFAQNAGNLSPLEAATQLFSIPGVTPQMVQVLPQLLQQQQLAGSLAGQEQDQNQSNKFQELPQQQPSSGLTTTPGIQATRQGYIPPNLQQRDARAKELYNMNPRRFGNDPNKAIEYADQEIARDQQINQAYQGQRQGEKGVQRDVQSNLQTQAGLLGADVPGNVYSDIEQRAVKSVLPIDEGGEGLTDEEAKIKYGDELDEASRQYSALDAIGSITWASQTPNEIMRNLKSTREQFKKRKDLRNFADRLISTQGLSPSKAYYLAYPTSENKDLSSILSKLPDVKPKTTFDKGYAETKASDYKPNAILNQIIPKMANDLGKEGSPLSVAEDLQAKGYDPNPWLDYLNENRDKLELTPRQQDELNKPRRWFPNLSDLWLFKLSNLDRQVD